MVLDQIIVFIAIFITCYVGAARRYFSCHAIFCFLMCVCFSSVVCLVINLALSSLARLSLSQRVAQAKHYSSVRADGCFHAHPLITLSDAQLTCSITLECLFVGCN
jgi:hypothetical protein